MLGFWRKCRIVLRCFRFAVWAVVLLALGALAWFNLVGLPGFLKTQLVASLHERGVNLEFSRMRLRLVHGLVCDNVRLGDTNATATAAFAAREVQLRLNFPVLLQARRWQLDGLVVRDGNFALRLSPTNALALTNLQTELRFQADDTWLLDHFRAGFAGVQITLAGGVAHAPEIQQWKTFTGGTGGERGALTQPLKDLATALEKIRFTGQPQLNAVLAGDARDVHSFTLRFNAEVPGVRTPWFAAKNFQLTGRLTAPADAPTNAIAGGSWTNLQPFRLDWTVRAADVRAGKISVPVVECAGGWRAPTLAVTNLSAPAGVRTPWFTARRLETTVNFTVLADAPANSAALDFWTNLAPFEIAWTVRAAEVRSKKVNAEMLEVAGGWHAPALAVTKLSVQLGGGQLDAAAGLDVATRVVTFTNGSAFDLHAVAAVLTEKARERLAEIAWTQPPELRASGSLTLPPWSQRAGDWRDDIEPTVRLAGELAFTNAVAGGVALDSVRTHFTYADLIWKLPDLKLAQGRTRLDLNLEESEITKNFQCAVTGMLDAASVKPFLTTSNAVRGFQHLTFHEPLALALAVRGNLRDGDRLAATGRLALTNFAIRGQTVDRLTAEVTYSKLTAEFPQLRLARAGGAQTFAADKLTLDLAAQKLFFTGGEGNIEPAVVARAIGPKTAKAMEPYQFLAIPRARVNGVVPLRHDATGELMDEEADLRFELVGPVTFRWRKFETPAITGLVWWRSGHLILTNAVADTYGGTGRGWGNFDLHTPGAGTDFQFFMSGTNVDLHRMGMALWSPTNELEGALSGKLAVTSANSEDWRTWNGSGDLRLRDGLLWNVPIFGLLSPVLNTFSPGLGNNRAKEAAGQFCMTNGVIHTRSLEIQTALMRLEYVGTVDLQQNVNARVTAHLMRNVPVIGSVFSLVFLPVSKAFECEATGTLGEPKATPVYLPFPKLLLAPLHPIRSVEEIFTAPAINAPAK